MIRRILGRSTVVLVSCLPVVAGAQSKDAAMSADVMSTESSRPLLLRKGAPQNTTGLEAGGVAMIAAAIEQARFDVKQGDFSSPEIPAWCMKSAADAAQRAGDVDVKGQAVVTSAALQERCSAVYAYTLDVRHGCSSRVEKDGKKTRVVWSCEVGATVVITRASARMSPAGTPSLSEDSSFGAGGRYVIHASGSATSAQRGDAERSAASSAASSVEREIRDVPGFQLRGPLTEATRTSADFCLGRDVLELDQPFYLVKMNERGEREDVGWGKVRDMHDGCVATEALQARVAEGQSLDLKPSRIETIIGRGDVRAGMTALEMPTLGANFGIQGGTTVDAASLTATRVDLMFEGDLARYVGASELYAFAHVGLVLSGDESRRAIVKQLQLPEYASTGGLLGLQGEFGLFKRAYFGRPFLDIGGAVTASGYNMSGETGEPEVTIYGLGVAGKVGLGVQASPRLALRLLAQARYAALESRLRAGLAGDPTLPGLDAEAGIGLTFGFLYTL